MAVFYEALAAASNRFFATRLVILARAFTGEHFLGAASPCHRRENEALRFVSLLHCRALSFTRTMSGAAAVDEPTQQLFILATSSSLSRRRYHVSACPAFKMLSQYLVEANTLPPRQPTRRRWPLATKPLSLLLSSCFFAGAYYVATRP